jgi:hypothetical protein
MNMQAHNNFSLNSKDPESRYLNRRSIRVVSTYPRGVLFVHTRDPERAIEMTKTSLGYDPVVMPNRVFHLGHSLFQLDRLELEEAHVRRPP